MGATLTEITTYSWYCDDCDEGGADMDAEHYAEEDMEEHNNEKHGGDEND